MSPMNNRLLVPRKTPGLLDLVPGAAAAYSLRSLSNSYAGPVVTVRRSSDDSEEDFTAAEVSDGTLAAFCGAGDGFVKQWWDQSNNARHASQTTAGYQPKIVSSGVVVTEEGKPALQLDGSDDFLLVNAVFTTNMLLSAFCVVSSANVTADGYIFDNSNSVNQGGGYSLRFRSTGVFRFWAQDALLSCDGGSTLNDVQYLVSATNTSGTLAAANLRINGASEATVSGTPRGRLAKATTRIGHSEVIGGFLGGTIQELIVYPSDQTANRELIEGNIAWGYSV